VKTPKIVKILKMNIQSEIYTHFKQTGVPHEKWTP